MAPLRIPRHDSGSVICQKTCQGLAPSTRATCSSSRLTDWKASRLALISKGRLTNIIPTTIPPRWSVKNKPSSEKGFPSMPCLPKTNSKAMPAAVCGIISGRSITPASRDFPGKFTRAIKYDSGMPSSTPKTVAMAAANSVSPMDLATDSSVMVFNRPSRVTESNVTRIGRMIKRIIKLAAIGKPSGKDLFFTSATENHAIRLASFAAGRQSEDKLEGERFASLWIVPLHCIEIG